jgi:hypothetical protein
MGGSPAEKNAVVEFLHFGETSSAASEASPGGRNPPSFAGSTDWGGYTIFLGGVLFICPDELHTPQSTETLRSACTYTSVLSLRAFYSASKTLLPQTPHTHVLASHMVVTVYGKM